MTNLNPGWVYFVKDGDAVKIGFSEDPKRRLVQLRSGPTSKPTLLATVSAEKHGEFELHQRFAHLRIQGEWFRAEPELLDFIASLDRLPRPFKEQAREIRQELKVLMAKYPTLPVKARCGQISDAIRRIGAGQYVEASYENIADCLKSLEQVIRDNGEFIQAHHMPEHSMLEYLCSAERKQHISTSH